MPINKLRNIAQDNSNAEFVLLIDVDFIPNKQLEHEISALITQNFFESIEVSLILYNFISIFYHPLSSVSGQLDNIRPYNNVELIAPCRQFQSSPAVGNVVSVAQFCECTKKMSSANNMQKTADWQKDG